MTVNSSHYRNSIILPTTIWHYGWPLRCAECRIHLVEWRRLNGLDGCLGATVCKYPFRICNASTPPQNPQTNIFSLFVLHCVRVWMLSAVFHPPAAHRTPLPIKYYCVFNCVYIYMYMYMCVYVFSTYLEPSSAAQKLFTIFLPGARGSACFCLRFWVLFFVVPLSGKAFWVTQGLLEWMGRMRVYGGTSASDLRKRTMLGKGRDPVSVGGLEGVLVTNSKREDTAGDWAGSCFFF